MADSADAVYIDTSGDTGAAADAAATLPKQRGPLPYRYVALLGLGYTTALLDRGNIAYAELEMGKELRLSEADFGFAAGLFFVPYCLLQIPCVRLMPAVGAHRVLAAMLLAWGATSMATAATHSMGQLCAVRIALGVFEAGYLPGAVYYISQSFAPGEVALPTAVLQGTGFFAFSFGSLVSTALMQALDGVSGLSGWRWLFVLQGIPAMIFGVAVLLLLPPPPGTAPGAHTRGRSAFVHDPESERDPGAAPARSSGATPSHRRHLLSGCADSSPTLPPLPLQPHPPRHPQHPPHPPLPPHPLPPLLISRPSDEPRRVSLLLPPPAPPPPPPLPSLLSEVMAVARLPTTWIFVCNHAALATLSYMSMFFLPQQVQTIL